MAAGRSLEFPALLLETDAELAAMHKRLKHDARMLNRAREQVREQVRVTRLQIAAGVSSCAQPPADTGRESLDLDMATGPPRWHPEHPDHEGN